MKKLVMALVAAIMLLSCATVGGNRGGEALQDAIEQSAEAIAAGLAPGTRVALVAFDSERDVLSDFIMEQLTRELFRRGIEVAEWRNLEFVFSEMRFQRAGYVSGETARSVGQFLGADIVITGSLSDMGGTRRLAADAIRVETAEPAGAAIFDVPNDRALRTMIAALDGGAAFEPEAAPPRTAGEFHDRGIMFLSRGENEIAAMNFSEALRLNLGFASAYLGRGMALLGIRHSSYTALPPNLTPAQFNSVMADLNEALRLNPRFGQAHFVRGTAHSQRGEFDRAIEDFTDALLLNPHSITYHRRGMAHSQRGELDRAIADLTQSLQLNPHNAINYHWRGTVHYRRGDFDRAIADLTESIRLSPGSTINYHWRGRAFYRRRDFDRAIADFTDALRLDASRSIDHHWRGITHYRRGDFDHAIADFTQSLWLNPNNAINYHRRGTAHYRRGDFDRAIADLTQSLRLNPNDAISYHWRGTAHYRTGDFDRAIADFEAALQLDPNDNDRQWLMHVLRRGW